MFGFKRDNRSSDLEQFADGWVRGSLASCWRDLENIKRDAEKFRITAAYLYGLTEMMGRQANLSVEVITAVYLRVLARHLKLSPEDIRAGSQILNAICRDIKYIKIMTIGINDYARLSNGEKGANASMLAGLISGMVTVEGCEKAGII